MKNGFIVRKAAIEDIRQIHRLLHTYSHQGDLIPRPLSDLYDRVRDFSVAADTDTKQVVGCCALQFCWEDLAEIRSLVVETEYRRQKVASGLVTSCIEEAAEYGMAKLFCLTFKPDFFSKFGFVPIERSDLPLKIWADCMLCVKFPDCQAIAMMKEMRQS
ncbi:MAG: N-acetyltransferase [Desulfobacterales bacterium]